MKTAQDTLGAFVADAPVAIAGRAGGPLSGLGFAVKDIYDVAGSPTGFGSPDWRRTHDIPDAHAGVVQQLLDAGADLLGKTHTDELAFSIIGENAHYGTPVNVNAPGRVPGGSSSGSAAAVAGGLVDFAIGSDTGGSVRVPASFCGLYGIRPTHGRIAMTGARPMAESFDVAGWFARTPEVLARVGAVLLGEPASAAAGPVRLLVAADAFALLDAAASRALQPALSALRRCRGDGEAVTVSEEGLDQWFLAFRALQGAEFHAAHGDWIARVQPQLGPGVRERTAWTATVSPEAVSQAQAVRLAVRRRMAELLAGDAVLVLPTVPGIAPLRNTPPGLLDDFRSRAMNLLCIAGLAGLPQINLPLATLENCPLGISLMAAAGKDRLLLQLAEELAAASRAC